MKLYLFIPGLLLMALTIYDLVYTALAPRGAGPISGFASTSIWRLFYTLNRFTKSRRLIGAAGVVVICCILIGWVLLLWLATVLVFSSSPGSIISSETDVPATTKEIVYYSGYMLSTMGNGDFTASTNNWSIYSSAISFTGLILITIAVTYIVPILSAVTERRALSIRIASIGCDGQAMLLNNWNGQDFKMLEDQFQNLAQEVAHQGQLHLTYPVLHYFHQHQKAASLLPNLASLDEALTLLLLYIPQEQQPSRQYLLPLRFAITMFIQTLDFSSIKASENPPPLQTEKLEKAGIQLLHPERELAGQVEYRRRILKSMVQHDGWEWEDLHKSTFNPKLDIQTEVNV